ncbi:MAG: thioredoxin [Salinibacterium sp.]|nr:thioredoxin [Salinibacterium sp.]
MNKRVLVIVLALAVILGGSVAAYAVFGSGASPDAPSTPVADATLAPESSAPTPETAGAAAGVYENYTDTAIANAQGTTLLFFHAPWCPQCRAVESDILSKGVPAGVTIIKVDFDSRQDVRQQYDVNQQTTFIKLDSSGKEVQRFVAYDNPSLQAVIDAML